MSRGQPDDPTNPLRRRPPRLEHDPEMTQIPQMMDNMRGFPDREELLRKMRSKGEPLREFMMYAFIAETGLRASDVVLVTKRTPHPDGKGERVEQYFRRRTAQDPVT